MPLGQRVGWARQRGGFECTTDAPGADAAPKVSLRNLSMTLRQLRNEFSVARHSTRFSDWKWCR